MSSGSYTERGVSPTKEEVHAAIQAFDAGIYPGAFCKIIEDLLGDTEYCNVMHADGAGTKSTIAYLHYKETGDATVFRGIAQDSFVMNIDDMACVGAVDNFVVSNTIGRNAHRINGAVLKEIIGGYEAFADNLRQQGIKLTMAGGETADLGDLVRTVIVDSTVFCRLKRSAVIDCSQISPGNVIVGLASFGQATYEDFYNSGIASNGFTAARHMLLDSSYRDAYPETYSETLKPEHVYQGTYKLSDPLPGSDQTVGEAILSPTRTYVPVLKAMYEQFGPAISGVIHSSGGGQVKCKTFGKGLHYIKDNLFAAPPIFQALAATGSIDSQEMYQVFNMGQRIEIYCSAADADGIIKLSNDFGIAAQIIGRVEQHDDPEANQVTIKTESETFVY